MITTWQNILKNHLEGVDSFLKLSRDVAADYEKSKREVSDIGFNAFTIASDYYYRENFHSDIICALLNSSEKHNEGNKFLFSFLGLLNKVNPEPFLKEENYNNSKVEREPNRIDILVTDEVSKKAIIIENKINNAVDQKRQLPRYLETVRANGFDVEAIVYLTLEAGKSPDKSTWTKEDIVEVEKVLKIIPSFSLDEKERTLYRDWLMPSLFAAKNLESAFLIRQYAELIKYLNINAMDTVSMEKFYESLKKEENLKTAISIRNMLNDLPEYLAIRIEEKYKNNCSPFKEVWRYKKIDTVFEACKINDLYLKLDVVCRESGYFLDFWDSKNEEYDIKEDFKDVEILKDFNYKDHRKSVISYSFELQDEEKLYSFIDSLLDVLTKRLRGT